MQNGLFLEPDTSDFSVWADDSFLRLTFEFASGSSSTFEYKLTLSNEDFADEFERLRNQLDQLLPQWVLSFLCQENIPIRIYGHDVFYRTNPQTGIDRPFPTGGTYGPWSYDPDRHRISIRTDEKWKSGGSDLTLSMMDVVTIASVIVHETQHAIDIKNGITDEYTLEVRAKEVQYNFLMNQPSSDPNLIRFYRTNFGQNGFDPSLYQVYFNDIYGAFRSWSDVPSKRRSTGSWWSDSKTLLNCN